MRKQQKDYTLPKIKMKDIYTHTDKNIIVYINDSKITQDSVWVM